MVQYVTLVHTSCKEYISGQIEPLHMEEKNWKLGCLLHYG